MDVFWLGVTGINPKSKESKKPNVDLDLTVTMYVVVLWQNPCDLALWVSEPTAAFHRFGAQLLWLPTSSSPRFTGQFSDNQQSLPVGCLSEGMQSPSSSIKNLPGEETVLSWKMFMNSFSLGYVRLSSLPFSPMEKAPVTEWQLVLGFPPVTSNLTPYSVPVLGMWGKVFYSQWKEIAIQKKICLLCKVLRKRYMLVN